MFRTYGVWNRKSVKLLWFLVILGLLASLPMIYERVRTESSAKKVEFVFDYRDLLQLAEMKPDPKKFVDDQLNEMKKSGIHSLTVYETTLDELRLSRRIDVYNSHDAAALTQNPATAQQSFTYVLYADASAQQTLDPILKEWFAKFNAKTESWQFNGRPGLIIQLPMDEAILKPLGPDPFTMEDLKSKGFQLVARISNRHQPFVKADMDKVLAQYAKYNVTTMVVEGESVPGYIGPSNPSKIYEMADLMKKYHMALASWEIVKPPAGTSTLAKKLDYQAIRLRSFSEQDADKMAGNLSPEELKARARDAADQFVLAVKDRNIRMILLNAKPNKTLDKGTFTDPLKAEYMSLVGQDGAIKRIQKAGYTMGPAHPFTYYHSAWQKPLKGVAAIGSVALIALTVSCFIPSATLLVFAAGVAGSLYLFVSQSNTLYQMLALVVGVSAATLSMVLAIRKILRRTGEYKTFAKLAFAIDLFIRTVFISLIGAAFIVAFLNHITYNLLIDQFRGVNVLAFLPLVLVAAYLVFFSEGLAAREMAAKAKRLLLSHISVIWVITAAVVAGASLYLLTRTGNTGQASGLELYFRSFLENTLRVRPRTKEFLIGNPLFIFGAYLCVKYRLSALYIVIIGAIGQASIVGTFTHLHTPLGISLVRVAYGMLFGVLIALALIAVWEILAGGWRKWLRPLNV